MDHSIKAFNLKEASRCKRLHTFIGFPLVIVTHFVFTLIQIAGVCYFIIVNFFL